MKVALLHPWFLEIGGSEKVVDVLAQMYPDADIFALFANKAMFPATLVTRKVRTSILNKLPFSSQLHGPLMPFYPLATESFDLREYDLVISSCGPAVMGVNVAQHTTHVCYCHTPYRRLWDLYAKRQAEMSSVSRNLFVLTASFMRVWEYNAMQRIDHVVSNSNYIADRVFKYFRRNSSVIYPPVETSRGHLDDRPDDYYLSVSRLGKEKCIDLMIGACNKLNRRLLIIGSGPEEKRLKAIAGPQTEFLGRVPDELLWALYAKCRGFLFAADEDFGIAPVEAQACGRPVIAYGHGGSLETVRVGDPDGRSDTGILFGGQTVESVMDGILAFEAKEDTFIPTEIQTHARQFDCSVFTDRMQRLIADAVKHP